MTSDRLWHFGGDRGTSTNPVRRRDEIDRGGAARLHTGVLEIFRAIKSSSELFLADRRASRASSSPFRSLLSSSPSSRLPSSELLYPAVSIFIFLIAPSHLPPPPTSHPFRWPRWRPLTKTYYPARYRLKGIGCGFLRDWTCFPNE